MKSFQIAFLISALAAVLFLYELVHVRQISAKQDDLEAQIAKEEGWLNLVYQGGKLIYNAATIDIPNLLDQVNAAIQEVEAFKETRAELAAERSSSVFFRDAGLVVCLGAWLLGDFLKQDEAKRNKFSNA